MLVFLNGSKRLHVLRDGPALRVIRPGCADRLYPLARIDTIWVSGLVEWQAAAWQACLRYSIHVYFYDGHGHFIGGLRPAPDENTGKDEEPSHLLERWLMTVEGRRQWRDWYNATLANVIRHSAVRCGQVDAAWNWTRHIDERLDSLVRLSDMRSFRTWLRSSLEALTEEQALRGGLGFERLFWSMIGIHPITDIANLLYWQIMPDCLATIRRMRKQKRLQPAEKLNLDGKKAIDITGNRRRYIEARLVEHFSTLLKIATDNILSAEAEARWSEALLGEDDHWT